MVERPSRRRQYRGASISATKTSGRFWSPTLLPTRGAGEYIARHGFGYSVFEHREAEIESKLCIYVATWTHR